MVEFDQHSALLIGVGAIQIMASAVWWFVKKRLEGMDESFKSVGQSISKLVDTINVHQTKIAVLETRVDGHAETIADKGRHLSNGG